MHRQIFSFVIALCLCAHWAIASLTSTEIANALNELAQQGFAAKDLVLEINSTSDAGPLRDVYTEIDTIVTVVLTDISFITNTPVITEEAQEQVVYEGYSNFVQSLLELMDAFASSAGTLMSLDHVSKYKVPAEVRVLESAVDAYFYNIISLFPGNSSYNAQASNQKAQVDTHCYEAIWAFDLEEAGPGRGNGSVQARWLARGSV
ncbi:uncharacterized protein BO80DRAFT_400791 [Aspergillus ibericus CBS 121593]|uniref:Uncharacterized protein n=1 Tax=Aspergillus ibericus CBS 121593 TaxID=1448316 RepID=A0A395H830_9EURO|nr:hypothetical protein BO80DRAFT_400791 [Aspergillus ibericus CBS 121593]RAL03719.1 hypothetical protein BO80DRAFT_400791 [Aspergillus ibericus CBS 121593]